LSASFPPLPPDLVAFSEQGRSLLVGTCSAALDPDCVRAVGLRIWPDASHLTILVPEATGRTALANVRENPRLALTISQIPSHRTMQIKGVVLAVREGDATDHELAIRYRTAFAHELAHAGCSVTTTERLGIWPCWAIDLAIEAIYAQTPGPSAGKQLTPEAKAL
jgi:pyridoxamine 5'-phosphate oxidase-like protein